MAVFEKHMLTTPIQPHDFHPELRRQGAFATRCCRHGPAVDWLIEAASLDPRHRYINWPWATFSSEDDCQIGSGEVEKRLISRGGLPAATQVFRHLTPGGQS
jgi:hypothetical protein